MGWQQAGSAPAARCSNAELRSVPAGTRGRSGRAGQCPGTALQRLQLPGRSGCPQSPGQRSCREPLAVLAVLGAALGAGGAEPGVPVLPDAAAPVPRRAQPLPRQPGAGGSSGTDALCAAKGTFARLGWKWQPQRAPANTSFSWQRRRGPCIPLLLAVAAVAIAAFLASYGL